MSEAKTRILAYTITNLSDRVVEIPKPVDGQFADGQVITLGTNIDQDLRDTPEGEDAVPVNQAHLTEEELALLKTWGADGKKNPGMLAQWTAGKKPLLKVEKYKAPAA